MANFNNSGVQLGSIQQADTIYSDAPITIGDITATGAVDWSELQAPLRAVQAEAARLVDSGQLDPNGGAAFRLAVGNALSAPDKPGRVKWLQRAMHLGAGVQILSGLVGTIGQILAVL